MKRLRVRLAMLVLAALMPLAGLLPSGALAHGADGETRVVGQRVGGYDVTVRTAPKRPRLGRLHIQVQLMAPESLAYVDGASVIATARLQSGEAIQAGPAPSRYRKPWYEMDLNLNKNGSWDVHVVIDGPRGQAQVTFHIVVGSE